MAALHACLNLCLKTEADLFMGHDSLEEIPVDLFKSRRLWPHLARLESLARGAKTLPADLLQDKEILAIIGNESSIAASMQ